MLEPTMLAVFQEGPAGKLPRVLRLSTLWGLWVTIRFGVWDSAPLSSLFILENASPGNKQAAHLCLGSRNEIGTMTVSLTAPLPFSPFSPFRFIHSGVPLSLPGKDGSYIKFDENAFVVISKNKAGSSEGFCAPRRP